MRARLIKWLVCLICHGDLDLVVAGSERKSIPETDLAVMNAVFAIDALEEVEIDVNAGRKPVRNVKCTIQFTMVSENADLSNICDTGSYAGAGRLD